MAHLRAAVFALDWSAPEDGWRLDGPEDAGRGVTGRTRFRVWRRSAVVVDVSVVGVEMAARVCLERLRAFLM